MFYIFGEELVPQLSLEVFPRVYGAQSILDVLHLRTPPKFGIVYEIHRGYCHLYVVGTSRYGFEVLFDIKYEIRELFGVPIPFERSRVWELQFVGSCISLPSRDVLHGFHVTSIRVLMTDIFYWMSSIIVLNSSANPLSKLIIVFCSTSNSSPRPFLCATELSGLPDDPRLL